MILNLLSKKAAGPEPRKKPVDKNSISEISNNVLGTLTSMHDKIQIGLSQLSESKSFKEYNHGNGIEENSLNEWVTDLLKNQSTEQTKTEPFDSKLSASYHSQIVNGIRSGKFSVDEICNREGVRKEMVHNWLQTSTIVPDESIDLSGQVNSKFHRNRETIKSFSSLRVFKYLNGFLNFEKDSTKIFIKADNPILARSNKLSEIVVLQRINDVRYINKYFELVNSKLDEGGMFAGCLETFSARRNRKSINKVPIISTLYFAFEFLFKRILPKVSWTKRVYFDITKGNDRLLSKAEGLGRLVSCGFKIVDFYSIEGLLYFVVRKASEPNFDMNPSYGPIYKMPRIGKNGRIIKVYKFRTMHPYSEYLQDYMVNSYGYASTGKPANDFRIPKWGRIMRKFWIDEFPQLFNVIKNEMKLVGVRPVSKRYFDDIPKEMQKLRLTQKPGCIPPYVSLDRKSNVMSVLQSEKEYLERKIQNPYFTDLNFFFKALYNIIFKSKRSA